MRYDLATAVLGMALLGVFGTAEAAPCKPEPGSLRPHCDLKGPARPALLRPKPQATAAAGVWSTHAFSENVWTQGQRPGAVRHVALLGRAAVAPRRVKAAREPEAVERWDGAADCLVVGDSIAVGVAQARPDCNASARSGISSGTYGVELLRPARARIVVISLGVNDDISVDTVTNLRRVRSAIDGREVFWLLPGIRERARAAIRKVATEFGDRLVDTRGQAGRDHLHPTGAGYEVIAGRTLGRRAS